MRPNRGGLRPDPAQGLEIATLDKEAKRATPVGLRGNVRPLCECPCANAEQTVAQTLTNLTWTRITLGLSVVDNDGIVDLANDIITIKYPGTIGMWGTVHFAAAAGGSRYSRFLVNGGAKRQAGGWDVVTTSTIAVSTHYMASMQVGQQIELQGFQSSGGNLNTFVTDGPSNLMVAWMAP